MYGDLSSFNNFRNVEDARTASAKATPREGERARRQSRGERAASCGTPWSSACGVMSETGAMLLPCAYPYWSMLCWGWEPTYRLMLQHDTIALARYVVTGPVRASSWDLTWSDSIEKAAKTKGVKADESDPAVRWLKDNILPLRRKVMRDAVRAVDFGWQPFAVTWEIRDGMYVPDVQPLLPDQTTVLQDDFGRFAGLENRGEKGDEVRFNDLESWAPTLDAEAGYAYGRSRLENIRTTAWAPWLDSLMQMRMLERKVSGIIPIVSHAPNGYEGEDGFINYASEADTILSALPNGQGVRLTALFDPHEILDKAGDGSAKAFLDYHPIRVDLLDAGNSAQAVTGFIQKLEYLDKKLFRGMLRPERAGLESVKAGSRADSEQHTETGAADSEAIDADLTEDFDNRVVRTALRLNFGEEKARQLHVISTPLQQWKQQVFREMLTRFASIPDIAISMAKALDVDSMFGQMSLPQLKSFVVEVIKANPNPPSDSGVGENQNGKPTEAQMNRLAEFLHAVNVK